MAMGNAWFAVQALDGTEAYTRAVRFKSRSRPAGHANGLPVLVRWRRPHRRATLGAEVSLGSDGTITGQNRRPTS